ncbi:hypothetical protein BY458DRAFT_505976 [Sporodiniella umbellata]|nr:hypothetical protein BY458DRAFT_505976 [Sporodiniella umbellata]
MSQALIQKTIESLDKELRVISLKIHDDPELGNEEHHAYALLTDYLEEKGFKVSHGVAGLATAFVAEFTGSEQGRRVGFCCEYDALPGVGHGCGHNLISIQGLACAVAIQRLIQQGLASGSVVLFGTPAEESTSGKISLVKQGIVQSKVDCAMMLHPFADDTLYTHWLALDVFQVEFFGKASHAGMAPWDGINALDALMQAFDNVAMLRQQIVPSSRIHGVITHGGNSPNVIPDYASAKFYVRSVTREALASLKSQVEACFSAAALATGCRLQTSWGPLGPVDDVWMNESLTSRYQAYREQKDQIQFPSRAEDEKVTNASTDMGNVSYVVPAIHPAYGIGTTAANHTQAFAVAARTPEAHQKTLQAAICLAWTAADVLTDPSLWHRLKQEFEQNKTQKKTEAV